MQEEPQPSSRQIVDDIAEDYKIGRYDRAMEKTERALQNPKALTKEHRALLRRVKRQLSRRLPPRKPSYPIELAPPKIQRHISEVVKTLVAELKESYASGGQEAVFAKIEQALQHPDLTGADLRFLLRNMTRFAKAIDPAYRLPTYPRYPEFSVLSARARLEEAKGDYAESLRYAWKYVQYCAVGTTAFHGALADLTDQAALFGDRELAQHAAAMYLSHYDLLQRAVANPVTPIGLGDPTNRRIRVSRRYMPLLSFPFKAALRGIAEAPAPCWVRILELAVATLPLPFQRERYQQAREALLEHYARNGDIESLARLQKEQPRSRERPARSNNPKSSSDIAAHPLYYILWYRLDDRDTFLLWYSEDRDGVVVDDQGRVLGFSDVDTLREWAFSQVAPVSAEEPRLHNLDLILQWLLQPSKETIDCEAFLSAWNLFIDVQASIERRDALREDPENDDIYNKLFLGCNLPGITPSGQHYEPVWTDQEADRLQTILGAGLHLLREQVTLQTVE